MMRIVHVKYSYWFLICFLILMMTFSGYAQISPGELTTAHVKLEGMGNCLQCHVLREKVTNSKCLECHTEMDKLIKNNRGYHVSAEVNNKDCFVCHNEHHGRNFAIVHFDPDTFNHVLAGYKLEGKHLETKCVDCHNTEFIKEKISQKAGDSYLGLETNCISCHTDHHQGALGNDCAQCHDFEAFRPAPGFDHQKTDFPLIGIHARTDCIKCHKKQDKDSITIQEFEREKVAGCADCHEDVHQNKFGSNCLQCHNQESFHVVSNLDNFNHNKTNFPLKGQHQKVDCKSCHKQSYTAKISYNSCTDCHADYHKGQLTQKGKTVDCNQCHSVEGFTPSNFTINQHQSVFKLEGGHLATPCFACHLKQERWEFKEIGKKCVDCHENIHEGFIDKKYYPEQNCVSCHSTTSWDELKFDHNLTSFRLEGQHAEQSCRNCHFVEEEDKSISQQFSSLDGKCTACHNDIHNNQFEEKHQNLCVDCHVFNDWQPLNFNHNKTEFKLEGGHKDVACSKCHFEKEENTIKYINYQFEEIKCATCHTP